MRRIVGRAVLSVVGLDVQQAAGALQLCAGQPGGIEAAMHCMRQISDDENTKAILLVDASNAFNQLNRQVALHNIRRLCPAISTLLSNTYSDASDLFVGGEVLFSKEGTTQGDPLAMAMYAVPLIRELQPSGAQQVW